MKQMLGVLRRLLLVLLAFAIVDATTAQLSRSAQYVPPMTMAGIPMLTTGAEHAKPMMPCQGMTPECIKQTGCATDTGLLARPVGNEIIEHSSTVDYWTAGSKLASLAREPEPLPPRVT